MPVPLRPDGVAAKIGTVPVNGYEIGPGMIPVPTMTPPGFIHLRTAAGTAYGAAELPEPQLRRMLERPDDLLCDNLARPVKISHDSVIVEADLDLCRGTMCVAYKQYRPRNWWKSLCGLFRRSRALRCWQLARALQARGILTAQPIAACQPKGWRRAATSYLATQWIAGAENLHLYGWRLAGQPMDERLRLASRCAESLGRLIGHMHASGVAHRDLKGANLLVVEHDGDVTTCLVDFDGVRICGRLSAGRRAANLARLAVGLTAHPWVTPAICCRFLHAYAGEFSPDVIAWKPLWRDIAVRSRSMVRRKNRRHQETL